MAPIPQTDSTVSLIYRAWAKRENRPPRSHLGASMIGRPCEREAWYAFHWALYPEFEGRILRLFDRGQREEPVFIRDLRQAGITVHAVDPETGKQFQFSDFGGHVGGSMDGAALGLPEAPKTWHVLEFKTHSSKSFEATVRDGVQKAHPEHYAQMQMYMHRAHAAYQRVPRLLPLQDLPFSPRVPRRGVPARELPDVLLQHAHRGRGLALLAAQ